MISILDNRIDRLVYDLYGLTDEEINAARIISITGSKEEKRTGKVLTPSWPGLRTWATSFPGNGKTLRLIA